MKLKEIEWNEMEWLLSEKSANAGRTTKNELPEWIMTAMNELADQPRKKSEYQNWWMSVNWPANWMIIKPDVLAQGRLEFNLQRNQISNWATNSNVTGNGGEIKLNAANS